MARSGRPGMSDEQKRKLWDRWKAGETISEISRALDRPPGSVFTILKSNGGYVPPLRKRRSGSLTPAERESISRGLARGESARAIARELGRSPSTVSREIARDKGRRRYRAVDAEGRAWDRARRRKPCLLACNEPLRQIVAAELAEDRSPQQIAGHLARTHEPGSEMRISHETIDKPLFIQARGVLAKSLQRHLRSGRPTRRTIHDTVTGQWRSQITGAVSIHQRPAEGLDRLQPGHWEGDLLLGRGLTQLDGRDAPTVTRGLTTRLFNLTADLRRTLTWDRRMESAEHRRLTRALGLDVYFADPRSPWQRGTNENTNRLTTERGNLTGKRSGRPPQWTKRQLIDGVRWRVRVGSPWRDVPDCYGSWQAVHSLFRRWQRAGIWARIVGAL